MYGWFEISQPADDKCRDYVVKLSSPFTSPGLLGCSSVAWYQVDKRPRQNHATLPLILDYIIEYHPGEITLPNADFIGARRDIFRWKVEQKHTRMDGKQ